MGWFDDDEASNSIGTMGDIIPIIILIFLLSFYLIGKVGQELKGVWIEINK